MRSYEAFYHIKGDEMTIHTLEISAPSIKEANEAFAETWMVLHPNAVLHSLEIKNKPCRERRKKRVGIFGKILGIIAH